MIGRLLPGSLRGRLLVAFAGLLTVTVTAVGIAVAITSSQQVLSQMHDRVAVGSHVLDRFLESRLEQLDASVRVLANDFGFRAAVATRDPATIETAMTNQGRRIGADLVVLFDPRGRPLSAIGRDSTALPFEWALQQARDTGSAVATEAYEGALYQFFVVPVLAPDVIGWVAVAFVIDTTMVAELTDLTELEVTFVALDESGAVAAAVSSLPATDQSALVPALRDLPAAVSSGVQPAHTATGAPGTTIDFTNDRSYLSAIRRMQYGHSDRIFAVLQMPTRIISDTTGLLIRRIAVVLAAALALAMPIGVWLAHRISDPVRRLIVSARAIEHGDYDSAVAVGGTGEVALLGSALATMQSGIREREGQIRHQADHDELTGLVNLAFLRRVYGVPQAPFTLCLLAVSDLKDIGFSFGYAVADKLLCAVADRLRGQSDVAEVARVGGRQFALILPALSAEAGLDRARALRRELSGTYAIGLRTVTSQCHCAVIGYPRDAGNFQTLYRGAEITLEAARDSDEGCSAFLPGREEERARQLAIIASFEAACSDHQLQLYYQPKIDLRTGQATECEALLRWTHPDLGFIPPDEFILLAERSGNIRRLTDWVLQTAIAQVGAWQRAGMPLTVSINLSAHDLADSNLHRIIEEAMAREQVTGQWLVMEITESAVMRDRERAAEALLALKALGIRLSIDDFGTGHSSLAQLKQLPVDELKIDKSFVLELDSNGDDALIVGSTIDLGHNLGLTVVAEGVESAASLAMLTDFGCDKAQGYLFSKPLAAPAFEAWLEQASGAAHERRAAS